MARYERAMSHSAAAPNEESAEAALRAELAQGDAVLRGLGALMRSMSREGDVPCRVGGEEFAFILPETAKADAERMAADVVVAHGKDNWTIAGTSIAPLISFSTTTDGSIAPVFAESGLDPLVKKLAKKIDRPAKDAGLKLVGGRVVATGASHEGRKLNAAGMSTAIISEIAARKTGAVASPVEAVVKAIAPKLTTADAKAFAPKMKVISSYSVWYQHIINNHFGGNIEGPATVLHGTVVPAGAKFDFWKEVGNLRNAPGVGG